MGLFDRLQCSYMLNSITGQFAPCESYPTGFTGFSRRFLIEIADLENIIFNLENFKSLKEIEILHF